jgi:hypothetical protein
VHCGTADHVACSIKRAERYFAAKMRGNAREAFQSQVIQIKVARALQNSSAAK